MSSINITLYIYTYPIGGVVPRPLARRFLLSCSSWLSNLVDPDAEVQTHNETCKRVTKATKISQPSLLFILFTSASPTTHLFFTSSLAVRERGRESVSLIYLYRPRGHSNVLLRPTTPKKGNII